MENKTVGKMGDLNKIRWKLEEKRRVGRNSKH